MKEKETEFAQEQLLSKKGGRLRLLSLSWTYTQQALANIKNKAMAKFGISQNVTVMVWETKRRCTPFILRKIEKCNSFLA